MSIKIMQRVWEHSRHKGNNLLTLLAIADTANDDGYCWPGVSGHLTKKTRLTGRAVGQRIYTLANSCELAVYPNPGTTHDYIVTVAMTMADLRKAIHDVAKKRGVTTRELALIRRQFLDGGSEESSGGEGPKNLRGGSEAGFGGGPKQDSDDPSLTVIESSSDDEDDEPDIFALYTYVSGREIASNYQREALLKMQAEYSLPWVRDAFERAVNVEAQNVIGYAAACLEDWQTNGYRKREAASSAGSQQRWVEYAADLETEQPERPDASEMPEHIKQARQKWDLAIEDLRLQLARETFDAWLRPSRLVDYDVTSLTYVIAAHNLQAREWLEHRLKSIILRTLRRVANNELVAVRFEVMA